VLFFLFCVAAAVGVGIAAGAVARVLQQATLEQKVPFTLRKHTLLLPVFAELLLGQFSFAQVRHCGSVHCGGGIAQLCHASSGMAITCTQCRLPFMSLLPLTAEFAALLASGLHANIGMH
jgi:hypothetical protein